MCVVFTGVQFERVITPEEALIFDFICGPSTQGVCQQLLGGDDPDVHVMPVLRLILNIWSPAALKPLAKSAFVTTNDYK